MKSSIDLLRCVMLGLAVTIIVTDPDSTASARKPGYGGVLVVPVMEDDGSSLTLDDLLAARRTVARGSRGRVLQAGSRTAVPASDVAARPAERPVPPAPTLRSTSRATSRNGLPLVQGRTAAAPTT